MRSRGLSCYTAPIAGEAGLILRDLALADRLDPRLCEGADP